MKKLKESLTVDNITVVAGIGVIVLGIVANIFSALVNQRFVHSFLDVIYYNRYELMLIGGFLIGWLIIQKAKTTRRLHNAIYYSLLTLMLSFSLDILRLLTSGAGYPLDNLLFEGMPFISLVVALILAVALRNTDLSISRMILLAVFAIQELYALYTIINAFLTIDGNPPLMIIPALLLEPVTLAGVAYVILTNVTIWRDRLFYAGFIGVIATIFIAVFWEFRTDPSLDATNTFSAIATSLMLIIVIGLTTSLRFANVGARKKHSIPRQRPHSTQQ